MSLTYFFTHGFKSDKIILNAAKNSVQRSHLVRLKLVKLKDNKHEKEIKHGASVSLTDA